MWGEREQKHLFSFNCELLFCSLLTCGRLKMTMGLKTDFSYCHHWSIRTCMLFIECIIWVIWPYKYILHSTPFGHVMFIYLYCFVMLFMIMCILRVFYMFTVRFICYSCLFLFSIYMLEINQSIHPSINQSLNESHTYRTLWSWTETFISVVVLNKSNILKSFCNIFAIYIYLDLCT